MGKNVKMDRWKGTVPPNIVEEFEYRGAKCIINKPHAYRSQYADDPDPIMREIAREGESCNGYVIANMPVLTAFNNVDAYNYATDRSTVHGGWTFCDPVGLSPKVMLGFDGQHGTIISPEDAKKELQHGIDSLIEAGIMIEEGKT